MFYVYWERRHCRKQKMFIHGDGDICLYQQVVKA